MQEGYYFTIPTVHSVTAMLTAVLKKQGVFFALGAVFPKKGTAGKNLTENSELISVFEYRYKLQYTSSDYEKMKNQMTVLTSGKLNGYLADLNDQAENTFFRLVNELSEKEGITEALKAENQMLWVQQMNALWKTATEIVNHNLIYK